MPHAPLLLREVAGNRVPAIADAVRSLQLGDPDVVVVISPHGDRSGVYRRATGCLDAFGPRGITVDAPTDESVVEKLAAEADLPVLEEEADHGVVVPLRLLDTGGAPVVAVTFAEGGHDLRTLFAEAAAVARALPLAATGTTAVVFSVNTSAGLSDRSPLPALPRARDVERAVLDALREDPARLSDRLPVLDRDAGSCGAAPLATAAALFSRTPFGLDAYEHPFGVGYAVASTRGP